MSKMHVREYYEKEAFNDGNGDKYVNVAWLLWQPKPLEYMQRGLC